MDIGTELVPVMWMCLCIPRHTVHEVVLYSIGTILQCCAYTSSELVYFAFCQPI